jgi:hypothetical protein
MKTALAQLPDLPGKAPRLSRQTPGANAPGFVAPGLMSMGRLQPLLDAPVAASEVPLTESMTARTAWHSQTAIHVIGLSSDGHEADCNHHQRHRADRSEDGIGMGPNHLPGRELLVAVITHVSRSTSSRMPGDPSVETRRPAANPPDAPGPNACSHACGRAPCDLSALTLHLLEI